MKTAMDQIDRLETLARRISKMQPMPGSGVLNGIIRDAQDIVEKMKPPVDPLLIKARKIANEFTIYDLTKGEHDDTNFVQIALKALRSAQSDAA